jgi:cytochrome bd ubiquinol oxidase subunit II
MSVFAAAVLFIGVVAYAVLGGADYGAGFWDLTAGGARRGQRPRQLIDQALAPVWEANHVWLIFCLVMLWTGFPQVFAAITTTLYVPLGLAALGIVVRGSGFAFRKVLTRTAHQRAAGAAFATSSVVTPFFLGTVAGGIGSGRVPPNGYGDPVRSWVNSTSLLAGVLAVAVCAFLAALFLTAEARGAEDPELTAWFGRRSRWIAVVSGLAALAGLFVLHQDAPRLLHGLLTRGLVLVLLSAVSGLAALFLARRAPPRVLQLLAVVPAGALVLGWGVAQYPDMLATSAPIQQAAAPSATLWALTLVAAGALLLILPSLALLLTLQQRGRLH